MKKYIILISILFSEFLFAQTSPNVITVWKYVTLTVNKQDTIDFPLHDSYAPGDYTNLPDAGHWTGSLRFFARLDTGNVSDSLACLLKPKDHTNEFFYWKTSGDSCFAFGSTSLTNYKSIGDKETVWSSTCSGVFDPAANLALIVKMGDLTGGTRRWIFGIVKEK